MQQEKQLAWTFDTVAEQYEKLRPGYVAELYRDLFQYKAIDAGSNVLEIGSGAGQATGPVLETGCRFTAVERGERFSRLLMQRYGVVPRFLVITGCFENAQLEENAYDLIYAASAFHWIPEREGYTKVFALLKPDGVFARFANHPDRFQGNRELTAAIDAIYDAYYYTYYHTKRKAWTAYTAEDARSRAELAEAYGFTDIRYHLYHRERVFSAAEYIELLGTYSDHIAIEGTVRKHFFQEIEAAIDRFGGTITLHDTIDLQMARKPG